MTNLGQALGGSLNHIIAHNLSGFLVPRLRLDRLADLGPRLLQVASVAEDPGPILSPGSAAVVAPPVLAPRMRMRQPLVRNRFLSVRGQLAGEKVGHRRHGSVGGEVELVVGSVAGDADAADENQAVVVLLGERKIFT